MSLDVATHHISADTAVVTLAGELTLGASLEEADEQLQTLIAGGVSKLVLDLTAVSYMDSAGLATILHIYGLTKEVQGALRLCGVRDRAASMLKMTRTDLFLPIDANREASLAALG